MTHQPALRELLKQFSCHNIILQHSKNTRYVVITIQTMPAYCNALILMAINSTYVVSLMAVLTIHIFFFSCYNDGGIINFKLKFSLETSLVNIRLDGLYVRRMGDRYVQFSFDRRCIFTDTFQIYVSGVSHRLR